MEMILRWFAWCASWVLGGRKGEQENRPIRSIGLASMRPDGSIVMWLRGEGPRGVKRDSWIECRPSDPDYDELLQHLGGLRQGETKSVLPWPD